jgi:phosphoribosylamine--glycine ligase
VLKPSGRAQNEKELLFVGEEDDGRDIVEMLERYKHKWSRKIKVFQLQKYIEGVEVAVGAFFNGTDFVMPLNVNFEHKRLFPGGLGPETGEMGTTVFFANQSPIFNATLLKMKAKLTTSGYVGYIDINCIVNSHGIYPLEFTSRFGYPHISVLMEGMISNWGTFLRDISKKEKPAVRIKNAFIIGFVIAVPPFPFEDFNAFKKYSQDATVIFKNGKRDGVHLGDVKLVHGDWHLAGSYGYALVVTAAGKTMENARETALKRIKNIMIPNMFYRTDIGETWLEDNEKLRRWGYI